MTYVHTNLTRLFQMRLSDALAALLQGQLFMERRIHLAEVTVWRDSTVTTITVWRLRLKQR